jgi:hypothetical protein
LSQRFASIVVDVAKLRDYCLSDSHPRGRHKARVFRSRLGLTAADTELFRQSLHDAAENHQEELQPGDADVYGQRYVLDFAMTTAAGTATVRSTWIILTGQNELRLTSCYVL